MITMTKSLRCPGDRRVHLWLFRGMGCEGWQQESEQDWIVLRRSKGVRVGDGPSHIARYTFEELSVRL
ncbi:Acetylxylan esterase 2 [Fusarium oxysporum f. sp. albedinis]|nr:Acetylxylan esterase 2 [Fusarium oxysporum f. sp. albedinis]